MKTMKIHSTGAASIPSIPDLTGNYAADLRTEIARRVAAQAKRVAAIRPGADVGAGYQDAITLRDERTAIEELRLELAQLEEG